MHAVRSSWTVLTTEVLRDALDAVVEQMQSDKTSQCSEVKHAAIIELVAA